MQPIYLVCGVSGSGKSWVCRQLVHKFNYIPHDKCWSHPTAKPDEGLDPKWGPPGSESIHIAVVQTMARKSERPIITECPFAERQVRQALEDQDIKVIPIFVIETPETIAKRYERREGKALPKAAMSRAVSIIDRANEWKAFHGTSQQVLEHLKGL